MSANLLLFMTVVTALCVVSMASALHYSITVLN
mgnify:CR=1 FL=1